MLARITIPGGVAFADLRLSRGSGGIVFAWEPIESICAASGIDVTLLRDTDESNVAGLIVAWYAEHLARGGLPDPIADEPHRRGARRG